MDKGRKIIASILLLLTFNNTCSVYVFQQYKLLKNI